MATLSILNTSNAKIVFCKSLEEIEKIIVLNNILYVKLKDGFEKNFQLERINDDFENFVTYSMQIS
jgi:hypothetical protein